MENEQELGDHVLVVGRVVHAMVRNDIVREDGNMDLKKAKILMHIGGSKFAVAEKEITAKEEE